MHILLKVIYHGLWPIAVQVIASVTEHLGEAGVNLVSGTRAAGIVGVDILQWRQCQHARICLLYRRGCF